MSYYSLKATLKYELEYINPTKIFFSLLFVYPSINLHNSIFLSQTRETHKKTYNPKTQSHHHVIVLLKVQNPLDALSR